MTAPTPAATGTLGATPLSQLLVYALERSLTGAFVFQSPENSANRSALTLVRGIVVKARVPSTTTALGQVCAQLGFVDAADIEQTAKQPRTRLFGEHLYDLGLIEREQLNAALYEQLYRQLESIAKLPGETQYGFYDGQNFLESYGGPALEVDPLLAIGRVTRVKPLSIQVTARVIAGLGETVLQLHPQARVGRFDFDASEQTILDVLRAKPQSYSDLMATDLLEPSRLAQLISLLALTKHLHVPGGLPLGVVASQSVSPVIVRRALPRIPSSVTPPDRESITSSPPAANDRRQEILDKVRALESADFYQVLGLEPGADVARIQSSFLQLAKAWHPDRLPPALSDLKPEVTKIFARMTEAHQILSNVKNRAEYDKLRAGGGNSEDEQRKVQEVLRAAAAFQKAEVLAKREDWTQALKFAEQAYQGDPEQAEYAALYAWVAAHTPERNESNSYEDLLEVLHRAVKQQRNNVRVRLYRAAVYKLAGLGVEAMRDYRTVSELDPTNVEAQREIRLHRMRKDSSPPPGVLKRFFNKKP